jgi:hypothetical protein
MRLRVWHVLALMTACSGVLASAMFVVGRALLHAIGVPCL